MPLSNEITKAANSLYRGSQSIRAVMNQPSAENRFTAALESLNQLADSEQIPIAIVGGLGAIRFGYPAATEDIDIAIGRDDLQRIIAAAPRYGFKVAWEAKSGWHTLMFGDVEINIIPEGAKARDSSPTTIPGPIDLGVAAGLDYADLSGWVELKISSGRQKDIAHIVEVLKVSSSDVVEPIKQHLAKIHPDYQQQFVSLLKDAEDERSQEKRRR